MWRLKTWLLKLGMHGRLKSIRKAEEMEWIIVLFMHALLLVGVIAALINTLSAQGLRSKSGHYGWR